MAEFTAVATQTVAMNQNILFTDAPVKGNCSIVHRDDSGLVTLRGITNQCRARYRVFFSGNMAIPTGGTVGPISLALAIDGEPVASSLMTVTPAAVEEFFNASSAVFINVPAGCCVTVSVENTTPATTGDILVRNANLIVERVA